MCCPACHSPIRPEEVQRYRTSGGVAFWICPNCDACFPLATEPVDALPDYADAEREALPA